MKHIIKIFKVLFAISIGIGIFFLGTKLGSLDVLKEKLSSLDILKENNYSLIHLIILLFISAFVSLAVHELGHLIVATYHGFRFEMFVIGFLEIKRIDGKIKVGLNKNIGLFGGATASSPVDSDPENGVKMAHIAIAGPVVSFGFGVACFVASYMMSGLWGAGFFMAGLFSIAYFLATTLPDKTGMYYTDRKKYERLTIPGPAQNEEIASLHLLGNFNKDLSYKNVNIQDIQTLIHSDEMITKYYGYLNLICYELEMYKKNEHLTVKNYEDLSKSMDKSTVIVFEKIIQEWKKKLLI
ncbi:MAG: M50 family metallopeptidase [Saprospiraceae bacterium]|nr:M50 family metallopeptidase [Saprospiraceae bacterium]